VSCEATAGNSAMRRGKVLLKLELMERGTAVLTVEEKLDTEVGPVDKDGKKLTRRAEGRGSDGSLSLLCFL
jgi:hypothetical protein